MSDPSSKSKSLDADAIEMASRVLPPSSLKSAAATSTVFVDSAVLSHEHSAFSNDVPRLRNVNESVLPPVDGGIGAWSFLAAAFVVEGIVWGFPNAYGIFLDSYLQDPRYSSQKSATSLLPLTGTLSSGIIYCSASVINPIAARYPHHRRKAMWLGAVLCCGSLFAASYVTEASPSGVVYAIGGFLLYLPCMAYMSEWFVARRGMANGILFAGTGAGGVILPLVLPPLISAYGSSKTLRILAIAIAILLFPLLPFVKGRLPQTRAHIHGPAPRGAADWMKQKSFWAFIAVNTLQGFAYFVPITYLPTFANDLHITSSNSAVTLAMLNVGSVVSRLAIGYLSDKVNPWILALSTLLTTSVTTFILWGVLSHSLAGLLAFGVVYGGVAGGWSSLWTGFVRPLAKEDPAMSTTLYGYLLLSRGIGSIVSTPISAKLYSQPHNVTGDVQNIGFNVGEGRFGTMIIYVGTCFAGAAGISALGWAMDVRQVRQSSRASDSE
ncbi:major facilitator superfamily domain-containing protein [Mycena epipterygia]|nr:major facilitator superfamily domain-containing protein [Mycena epipterygia]